MKHYLLLALLLTFAGLMLVSCHDTPVEPSKSDYPLELTVVSENSSVELHWTELTVSSFEEYIIVRSQDPIPDSPEPELIGNAIIVERIDKVKVTEFIDFAPPISKTVYYKVFGKIDGRFLPTPAVRVDLSIQIIDLRADFTEIDQDKQEIIGFDRTSQSLFIYNYATEKIRVQTFASFSNPTIRIGNYNGVDEIYVTDQSGVMYIYSRANLHMIRQSTSSPYSIDFIYDQGRFILARYTGDVVIMDRATLQIQDIENGIFNQRSLLRGVRTNDELEILEVGINQINKYIVEGNSLRRVGFITDIPGGSLKTAEHPDGRQFVVNSTGRVLNNELEFVAKIEDGLQFYNQIEYTEDGSQLFTAGFQVNEFKLKFFDVEDEYNKISENKISVSPIKMFADDDKVYLMSIVFLNGAVRTAIFNYKIP